MVPSNVRMRQKASQPGFIIIIFFEFENCNLLMKVKSLSSDFLRYLMDTRLLPPWDFPGKGTGVGCHFLLHQPGFKSTFGHYG